MRATPLVVLSALALVPIVQADVVTPMADVPDLALNLGTWLWTGDAIHMFGGPNYDGIVRYDPTTGDAVVMAAKLPTMRHGTSAIWTGEKAYLFGGNVWTSATSRDIVEYDPATDTVRLLDAKLPVAVQSASAVWTGEVAYILGGSSSEGSVARFDPASGTVTRLPWKLPHGYGAGASGAWAGGVAVLIGGRTPDGTNDDILHVDVETGATTVHADRLGQVSWSPAIASDGRHVYVFGASKSYDEVLRHDAVTGHTEIMPGRIPTFGPAAVWAHDRAYVIARGCSWCAPGFEYVPQAYVPRPSVTIVEPSYHLRPQEDGTFDASFYVDVEVDHAPIYDLELRVGPAPTARPPEALDLTERTAINWFEVTRREEGRTHWPLLFVVRDITPFPVMCLRLDGHSGSTRYGAVSSEPVCVPATV